MKSRWILIIPIILIPGLWILLLSSLFLIAIIFIWREI